MLHLNLRLTRGTKAPEKLFRAYRIKWATGVAGHSTGSFDLLPVCVSDAIAEAGRCYNADLNPIQEAVQVIAFQASFGGWQV